MVIDFITKYVERYDMIYNIGLYAALTVLIIGLLLRFARWFRIELGPDVTDFSPLEKLVSITRIKFRLFVSFSGLLSLLRVFINDILFQKRILKTSPLRWGIHMAVFYGFVLLLLLHVFDESITLTLFPGYVSTLNPWMFLRNLLGLMVLGGGIAALVRRCSNTNIRPSTSSSRSSSSPSCSSSSLCSLLFTPDFILLIVMLMIIVSGFFLESTQIISQGIYNEMVEDYSDIEDEEELRALAHYWKDRYGVIFSDSDGNSVLGKKEFSGLGEVNFNEAYATLNEIGAELNETYCIECHSRPANAFLSYSLSLVISPAGHFLNRFRADICFWYLHILSSFLALAILPFTKIFHLISTPLSLAMNGSEMNFYGRRPSDLSNPEIPLQNRVVEPDPALKISVVEPDPALVKRTDVEPALALKRAVELDACVQCGACSAVCSVAPMIHTIGNRDILPSEKIRSIKGFTLNQKDAFASAGLAQGSHICTDCFRCNEVCPAGIDLKDIWNASKKSLDIKGFSPTHIQVNRQNTMIWAKQYKKDHPGQTFREKQDRFDKIPSDPAIFSNCVQCSICSNVCPVVEASRSHSHDPGLTPQQVMNLLRLELRDVAMFSGMVWNCTTCYMCQEHCPQEIQVADILCSLRNRACEYLESTKLQGQSHRIT